ncbi:MAG: hypothetical protein R3C30_12735 [Hyphomonadaceae bacterium]
MNILVTLASFTLAVMVAALIAYLLRLSLRLLATGLRAPSVLLDQSRRDALAASILERLKNGETVESFALYLRPFAIDHATRLDLDFEHERFSTSLEGLVYEALQHEYPIISLGVPMGFDRSGTVSPGDAGWRDAFGLLVTHAKLILVVPLLKEGTFWEILTIKEQDHLSKTVFLVPPSAAIRKLASEGVARAFEVSRRGLHSRGIAFPEFGRGGGLFRVDEHERCRTAVPFPSSVLQMRVDVSRLFAGN